MPLSRFDKFILPLDGALQVVTNRFGIQNKSPGMRGMAASYALVCSRTLFRFAATPAINKK
jgi:hypothetical protein